MGDFNCIHDPLLDKVGGNPDSGTGGAQELLSLANHLNTTDIFRFLHPTAIEVTFSTAALGARLDRIYLARSLRHTASCKIIHPPFSDHEVVSASFLLSSVDRGKSYWKLNTSFLQHGLYQDKVKQVFAKFPTNAARLGPSAAWEILKKHVKATSIRYGIDQQSLHKYEKDTKLNDYERAKAVWTAAPTATNASVLQEAKSSLDSLQQRELDAAALRSRASWLIQGERPTRLFCSLEKQRQQATTIESLMHPSRGTLVSSAADLCDAARSFYERLYTPEQASDPIATDKLLEHLPSLSKNQATACDTPISLTELTASLRATPKNKTPGLDGLPAEFYVSFWSSIGPILLQVLQDSLSTGSLPPSMRTGVLCLLYKKGDTNQLSNYRPLTMINTDAKLLCKVLSRRLDRVISSLVHPDQTGFIGGRYIHENTMLVRETQKHFAADNSPRAILFVDQEKAFDRCDWSFRDRVLQRLGFGPYFLGLVSLLHNGLNSSVLLNGHISAPFQVKRGTRQGDPFSPGLFALLDEAFSCALRHDPLVHGIPLPDGGYGQHCKISQYADDKAIFLGSPADIAPLQALLRNYEAAAGARINTAKSCLLLLGRDQDPTVWSPLGVPSLQGTATTKYLGVPIGPKSSDRAIWESCRTKLERVLGLWRHRDLSLLGRVTVLRSLATSQLWYLASVCSLPPDVETQLTASIWSFLWRGKQRGLVNRNTCLLPRSHGGLNMIHLPSMVQALQLSLLRRLLDPSDGKWKHFINNGLRENTFSKAWSLGLRTLYCSVKFAATQASTVFPTFWRGVLASAQQLQLREAAPATWEEVLQQHLYYNDLIKSDGHPLGDRAFLKLATEQRISTVRDLLLPPDHKTIASPDDLSVSTSRYDKIWSAIPTSWRTIIGNGPLPLQPGEWASSARHHLANDVLRVSESPAGHPEFVTCSVYALTQDNSFAIPPPDCETLLCVRASTLHRANVALPTSSLGIFECCTFEAEVTPSRLLLQGPKTTPTPILSSSVKGTYLALLRVNIKPSPPQPSWSSSLQLPATTTPPWPTVWRNVWHPARRQKISDFLWRLWHRRLFLGTDRRRYDNDIDCPHCNCLETYEHFLFECPISTALWEWVKTKWRDLSGRHLAQDRLTLLLGPRCKNTSLRRLWVSLQGEALYALWIQRCRSRLDNDPTLFSAISVVASANANLIRSLQALEKSTRKCYCFGKRF